MGSRRYTPQDKDFTYLPAWFTNAGQPSARRQYMRLSSRRIKSCSSHTPSVDMQAQQQFKATHVRVGSNSGLVHSSEGAVRGRDASYLAPPRTGPRVFIRSKARGAAPLRGADALLSLETLHPLQ